MYECVSVFVCLRVCVYVYVSMSLVKTAIFQVMKICQFCDPHAILRN